MSEDYTAVLSSFDHCSDTAHSEALCFFSDAYDGTDIVIFVGVGLRKLLADFQLSIYVGYG